MKNQAVLLIAVITTAFTFQFANAEPMTAAKGLEKIKTNLATAKKNSEEYNRNLEVVKANMNEIKRTKEALTLQKKNVSTELVKNTESMNKISAQEREINGLVAKEKEKLNTESKQLQQLESLVAQIKVNQQQRNEIIANYQTQLGAAQARKTEWKDRENALKNQEAKASENLRTIASDENSWNGKKQKFEKESRLWTAEAQKQQKIHDSYHGMAQEK